MKRLAVALALAGCADDTTPEWQLAYDRVVAVQVTPPHIVFGEVAQLSALVAHDDGPTEVVSPTGASAAFAPGGLFTAVHFNFNHWEIDGAGPEQLDQARAELGLAAGEPVPLSVTLQFPGPLYAEKIVWLGDSRANPADPELEAGGVALDDTLSLDSPQETTLVIEAAEGDRVRTLTSCGELDDHDSARATLRVVGRCEGELAAVVRDAFGGVSWRVWPLRVQ